MALKFVCVALAALAVAVSGDPQTPDNRLVGGTPSTIEEFPYIVAIVYYYPGPSIYIQRCVGSIISSWHILTTAFCFTGANVNNMLIRAGSTNSLNGGILSTIREVIIHPDYVAMPRENDIAVTVINFPLSPSSTIGILFLPPQNWYIPDGQQVQIVSWGFESESGPQNELLQTLYLNKLSLNECQESYANSTEVSIKDSVICASQPGPAGICFGDSGAPMAIGTVVVGLSSYYDGCDDTSLPDVFTRIDRHTDWIVEVAVAPTRANGSVVRAAPAVL